MTAAVAIVHATRAVATVDTARLAFRTVADGHAVFILPSSQCLARTRCPMRRMFATATSKSGQLLRRVNGHRPSVLTIFATLLPACHGEM
jgi:hypothetical protein